MPEEKKGILGKGNLLPKILILIAVGAIVSVILFGLPATIPDFIWFIIRLVVGIVILIFAFSIMRKVVLGRTDFSPTTSWRNKLVKIAEMSKPPRTRKLFMRGESMHLSYYFGKITGLLFLPTWSGVPVLDKKGKFIYIHKHDKQGKPMYDNDGKPLMVNELTNINESEGDWLFIVTKGLFPAISQKFLVRANVDLVTEIMEQVYVKTVNLVPVGHYFYPHQQWQSDISRINMQHLAETIQETHMAYLDLCATTTESSLRSDPFFVKVMQANTENISSKESNSMQQLGNKG